MSRFAPLRLVPVGFLAVLLAAVPMAPSDPPVKGFLVHEWGVFRVHDDAEFANADMRAEWDDLPSFVYGQTTTRDFPRHWDVPPTNVYKPVIFFHALQPMEVNLRVTVRPIGESLLLPKPCSTRIAARRSPRCMPCGNSTAPEILKPADFH